MQSIWAPDVDRSPGEHERPWGGVKKGTGPRAFQGPKAWGMRSIQPGLTNRDLQAPQTIQPAAAPASALASRCFQGSRSRAGGHIPKMRRLFVSALNLYRVLSGEDRGIRLCEFCSSAAIAEPCPASAGHGREGRSRAGIVGAEPPWGEQPQAKQPRPRPGLCVRAGTSGRGVAGLRMSARGTHPISGIANERTRRPGYKNRIPFSDDARFAAS